MEVIMSVIENNNEFFDNGINLCSLQNKVSQVRRIHKLNFDKELPFKKK